MNAEDDGEKVDSGDAVIVDVAVAHDAEDVVAVAAALEVTDELGVAARDAVDPLL